ncbi:MAG TPA: PAS domain-containing sensor histidine kinase [Cytophagaceae bacterium]|nr:PAS domain-containing sensor histidine kinase [Cytophagaceae bacterium]
MSSKNLNTIINLLLELASGNLTAKGIVSPRNDDYDAIITGINILTEELQHTTVSKDYLNSIYKGIADMLFILDKEENISEINDAAYNSLKLSPEVLIGKSFRNLFLEPAAFNNVFNRLKRQGYFYNLENVLFTKDGEVIPVSCTASCLKDKTGKVIGYLFIAKDISKIKKTEEELKLKNKELDTFLYKAAHDLKSPVTTIQGLLNIANMEIKDAEALKYFEMIKVCAHKLDNILISLKDTVEADIRGSSSEQINFDNLIEEVLDEMHNSPYYSKDVTIRKNILQKYKVHTKQKTIHYALYQIIENAYKFRTGKPVSMIDIRVSQSKTSTDITITDNGIGIQKKYQEKIFEMFYKANSTFDGAGLGLYSAQSMLTRVDGHIHVDSVLKKGSSFTISFPNILVDSKK